MDYLALSQNNMSTINLHNNDTGGDHLSQVNNNAVKPSGILNLLEDYPEPLTQAQRNMFQHHVSYRVRRHSVIHHSATVVRRGWNSLQEVTGRLKAEEAALVAALDALASEAAEYSTPKDPAGSDECASRAQADNSPSEQNLKRSRGETENGAAIAAAPPSPALEGPPRRRPGGLLRSAMFANLQSVLRTAKKEEAQQYSHVTHNRDRISRETRLSLVREDLASQEKHLAPLQEKLEKCQLLEAEAAAALAPVLALMGEMFDMEMQYASSFFLKAAGRGGVDKLPTDSANESSASAGDTSDSGVYEIPFSPAFYTPESEDIIRTQVEEMLDQYLAYRARMDPILTQLEEEKQTRQAKRVDQLMSVIGLGVAGSAEVANFGSVMAPSSLAYMGVTGNAIGTLAQRVSHATSSSAEPVKAGVDISDSDSNGGGEDVSDAEQPAEESDKRDRQMIQSALDALGDFDELY